MCTHAAPSLRLDIETEWDTPHNSNPWNSDPTYRFSLQQETSTGWTALQEAGGFTTPADAAEKAATALRDHLTTVNSGPAERTTARETSTATKSAEHTRARNAERNEQ